MAVCNISPWSVRTGVRSRPEGLRSGPADPGPAPAQPRGVRGSVAPHQSICKREVVLNSRVGLPHHVGSSRQIAPVQSSSNQIYLNVKSVTWFPVLCGYARGSGDIRASWATHQKWGAQEVRVGSVLLGQIIRDFSPCEWRRCDSNVNTPLTECVTRVLKALTQYMDCVQLRGSHWRAIVVLGPDYLRSIALGHPAPPRASRARERFHTSQSSFLKSSLLPTLAMACNGVAF
ncbi:Arginine biosynthesis bifunctional protein ArgJ [Frankliniella fusca]|uniref:Arginine biosynthesis bifunctional protein ArgJ n=1 Tax=Frankliniella fusca TaxID=407009 RepID=A0AAE1I0U2_9NEOP|nr:Arginine biosynthesis bifunctional protein ArgJ [Frankliniella fusca]